MIAPAATPPVPPMTLAAPERLAAIADLALVGPDALPISPAFPSLLRDTALMIGVSAAFVSVVLDTEQRTFVSHGLTGWMAESNRVPLEWAPCRHVVTTGQPLAIEDTFLDPRSCDSPLVTRGGMRTYIGVPLTTTRGVVVGALGAVGPAPVRYTVGHVAALRLVAAEIMRHLEARRDVARALAAASGTAPVAVTAP